MSEFTYEKKDTSFKLECFEWDNVWFEHTEINDKKRIFYVGDSISCGIRRIATASSDGELLFDGFGTSKNLDNPFFIDSLKLYAAQLNRMDAILFNNGLHGWNLPEEEYEKCYDSVISQLIKTYPDIPIFILLSTNVADPNRAGRVIERNNAAVRVAEKYSLKVIDIHTLSVENKHLLSDGVHFVNDGYKIFAEKIVSELKAAL